MFCFVLIIPLTCVLVFGNSLYQRRFIGFCNKRQIILHPLFFSIVFRSTTSITTPTIVTHSSQPVQTTKTATTSSSSVSSSLTTGSSSWVTARTAVLQAINQYDESKITSLETKFITVAVIGAFVLLALIILLVWLILCRGVCHRVSPSNTERLVTT